MEISAAGAAERIAQLEEQLARREAELAELRLALEVFASMDARTGLPNLNGMVEALVAAADVLNRHGEAFGVIGVRFPGLSQHGGVEAVRHLGAVLGAGLREIDRVGILDQDSFLAVARDCDDEGVHAVIARLTPSLDPDQIPAGVDLPRYAFIAFDESEEIRPDEVIAHIRGTLAEMENPEVIRLRTDGRDARLA